MEHKDPGRYIPIIYLLYSWGSLFGVPSRVPLNNMASMSGPWPQWVGVFDASASGLGYLDSISEVTRF